MKKENRYDEIEFLAREYRRGKKHVFKQLYKKMRPHFEYMKGRYRVHDSFIDMAMMKALKDALDTYDPLRGSSFKTHFTNHIKKMDREIRETGYVSHVPESVIRDWHKIQRLMDSDPSLSHQEIAKKLNMSPRRVKHVMDMMSAVESTSADFFITENYVPALDTLEGIYHEEGHHEKLKVLQAMKHLKTTNYSHLAKHLNMDVEKVRKHVKDILSDVREINAFM